MTNDVLLRDMVKGDLATFFEHQQDPVANHMAAFTVHWTKVMANNAIVIKTILYAGNIASYILTHGWFGKPEISYWLGKEYWGKGIATAALAKFLGQIETHPNLRPRSQR